MHRRIFACTYVHDLAYACVCVPSCVCACACIRKGFRVGDDNGGGYVSDVVFARGGACVCVHVHVRMHMRAFERAWERAWGVDQEGVGPGG